MLFSSYPFILAFLPVAFVGFAWLSQRGDRGPVLAWLLLCSLFFYAYWNPWYVLLLAASMAGNFAIGRGLERLAAQPSLPSERIRRLLLVVGVSGNLALLGYYKYAGFFVDTVRATGLTDWSIDSIALPLGISFFTFQQVGYVVDRSRGGPLVYSFTEYCLFVTFFPQLIAGPIVDHRALFPQFNDPKAMRVDAENLAVGVTIFLIGLFKKIVLADQAAEFATALFTPAPGSIPSAAEAWVEALAYSMQLYFDFSGYSDMAIGLGRMFGVQIPLNFNSPYRATSIIEFWRRWHMTLSAFLRDHIYIPLGGSRKGLLRRHVNLTITMLLGGLWHGAGWTFVAWGGLHGVYLMLNHGWVALRDGLGWRRDLLIWRLLGGPLTFLAVMLGWIFFRGRDLDSAWTIVESMFGVHGWSWAASFKLQKAFNLLAPISLVAWFCPNTQQLMADFRPAYDWDRVSRDVAPLPRGLRWLAWQPSGFRASLFVLVAAAILLHMGRVQEFLYFQF